MSQYTSQDLIPPTLSLPLIEGYQIDPFGYLEIEFKKNQVSYLYELFLEATRRQMRAEQPHLCVAFRLIRMSYELINDKKISNICEGDLAALERIQFSDATSQLYKVINWAKVQNLPGVIHDYVLEADRAVKNVKIVVDG